MIKNYNGKYQQSLAVIMSLSANKKEKEKWEIKDIIYHDSYS